MGRYLVSFYSYYYFAIVIMFVLRLSMDTVEASSIQIFKRFTVEDICYDAIYNRTEVGGCPGNDIEAQNRSHVKGCHMYQPCNGEQMVYHCVRHNDLLLEVCAPRGLIIGKCCAQFNIGVGRVIADYDVPCPLCPFKYNSDDSWRYSSCVKCSHPVKTTEPGIESTTVKLSINPCNKSISNAQFNEICDSEENSDANEEILLKVLPSVMVPTGIIILLFGIRRCFPRVKFKTCDRMSCLKSGDLKDSKDEPIRSSSKTDIGVTEHLMEYNSENILGH